MIRFKGGFKYQLEERYQITLPWLPKFLYRGNDWIALADKVLTIHRGYAWDGPSGPALDSKSAMRASLVHDALYQLMREGVLDEAYRINADQTLRDLCVEDGMSPLRAWFWFKAVQFAAGPMARKGSERPILTAP